MRVVNDSNDNAALPTCRRRRAARPPCTAGATACAGRPASGPNHFGRDGAESEQRHEVWKPGLHPTRPTPFTFCT